MIHRIRYCLYRWGTGTQSEQLICGNNELRITSDLSAALKQLRSSTEDRRLWIDQVCINQAAMLDNVLYKATLLLTSASGLAPNPQHLRYGSRAHDQDQSYQSLGRNLPTLC